MQALSIVLMSIVAAVIYGILHDQITARVCVEYFTIGHPPVFETDDPTLLGLGWGVIATWWAGLLIGVPLAIAARVGSRPKRSVGTLFRPIANLLCSMAICACLAVPMWPSCRTKRCCPPFRSSWLAMSISNLWHLPS